MQSAGSKIVHGCTSSCCPGISWLGRKRRTIQSPTVLSLCSVCVCVCVCVCVALPCVVVYWQRALRHTCSVDLLPLPVSRLPSADPVFWTLSLRCNNNDAVISIAASHCYLLVNWLCFCCNLFCDAFHFTVASIRLGILRLSCRTHWVRVDRLAPHTQTQMTRVLPRLVGPALVWPGTCCFIRWCVQALFL